MAAGMGSRYGGLKQIDPIDAQGHMIIDFSVYDAIRAGFEKIIFVIKEENQADFSERIGNNIRDFAEVEYVYQDIHNLPEGYEVPEGRVKPWGTGHAVLSCLGRLDGPFAVINADDYYGKNAFSMIYDYLSSAQDDEKYRYAMVGYVLGNTLTENGYVARGICTTGGDDFLLGIKERTRIEKKNGGAAYTEDDGKTWTPISEESLVSMNMWGFTNHILTELKDRFKQFLDRNLPVNPLKCEYFLPNVVGELLKEDKAAVKVLKTMDKWYGVTYKEDKQRVVSAIGRMKRDGLYPEKLWSKI